MSRSNPQFVITTKARGATRTLVWDTAHPLPLGYPFQWVLEKTELGVRARNLRATRNDNSQGNSPRIREVAEKDLDQPVTLNLDPLEIRIQPVRKLSAAFGRNTGSLVHIYACRGNGFILDSTTIDKNHTATVQKKPVFTLDQTGEGAYRLKSEVSGTQLQIGREPIRMLQSGEAIDLKIGQLPEARISFGQNLWRFSTAEAVAIPAANPNATRDEDPELALFIRSLKASAVGLAALLALSLILPKTEPKPDELIPPQVAKLVLSNPAPQKAESGSMSEGNKTQAESKQAPKTTVVQAFRSQALKNSVNGLLKGGMTRLLAQSEFVSGAASSAEARKMLSAQNNSLTATAPVISSATHLNVRMASLGGEGSAGPGGTSVGYGKGEKAGVKGQGKSFIALDNMGSSVEEGLTKEEVGEVIHRHLSEVRYCYESAILRTPELEGKLIVNFVIGGSGMVKSSDVKTSTLTDPRLDDCILRRLGTWKFPATKGGINVAVSYPFIFKTLGR